MRTARPAVVAAALLVGAQLAGKATRDALFLSSFDVAWLPPMTGAAALVSLLGTLAFSRAMARRSPIRLLPAAVGASALLFLAEWALSLALPRAAAVAVYLHQAVLGAVLISGFWSLVNERYDPHTAKRNMGAIGTGASLGGVLGALLTWAAAKAVSIPTMLGVLAVASLLGLASLLRLKASGAAAFPRAAPAPSDPDPSALRLIRDTPYLRNLALLVALCAFVEALLEYLLGVSATASYARGTALMSFYALFHGGAGLLALVVQATLVRAALQGLGVAGTLAVQPAVTALTAVVTLAFPRLASVVALRGSQTVLRNSTFRSAYELLYTPLPNEQKRPTKVVVDVAFDRLGTMLGSGLVILVLFLAPVAAVRILPAIAAGVAVLALALAPRLHRGYVRALASSLRSGTHNLEPEALVDPTALLSIASVHQELPARAAETLRAERAPGGDPVLEAIADLRSADASRMRRALAAREVEPALVPHLVPLLADDGLFDAVATSLRRAAPHSTGQLVDALLDRRLSPVVRRRVARVLRGVPSQRAADGLLLGLADERFDIRCRSAQALERMTAHEAEVVLPREEILQAVRREAPRVGDSPRHLDHVFTLLGLILDREPLEMALRALRSGDEGLRGTALEYLENVLPAAVREELWPQLGFEPRLKVSGRSPEEVRDDLLRSTASLSAAGKRRTVR